MDDPKHTVYVGRVHATATGVEQSRGPAAAPSRTPVHRRPALGRRPVLGPQTHAGYDRCQQRAVRGWRHEPQELTSRCLVPARPVRPQVAIFMMARAKGGRRRAPLILARTAVVAHVGLVLESPPCG
jgi:hypothetical protein